jgi:hypothetical protein
MRFLFLTLALVLVSQSLPTLAGPLHASCNLDWDWPSTDCKTVQDKLLNQIQLWNDDKNCPNGAGEKCLYKTQSHSDAEIKATHTTPKKGYVDDLTFSFTVTGSGCKVHVILKILVCYFYLLKI